ncbi:MAG TPA: hypothetical protein VN426_15140 [Syntrophomonadaceae bacterium]|nr:hypothetical protein [Syntrophomonadaceae bacterium]
MKKVRNGAGWLRLYYICDCCREVYQDIEVEGPQGAVEVTGLCPDCGLELGIEGESNITNWNPSYN